MAQEAWGRWGGGGHVENISFIEWRHKLCSHFEHRENGRSQEEEREGEDADAMLQDKFERTVIDFAEESIEGVSRFGPKFS